MTTRAAVFDSIMLDYLTRVTSLNHPERVCSALGITHENGGYRIPFFNREYTITADAIVDRAGMTPAMPPA